MVIELSSGKSFRASLDHIRNGNAGLNKHRQSLLDRVPNTGNWAKFSLNHLNMKDLAYLTAKTGHEFAILRGKNEDILFHGDALHCTFDEDLADMLINKHVMIFGHSHPADNYPTPSPEDRKTLERLNQASSKLISGMTGLEITFTSNLFDDLI